MKLQVEFEDGSQVLAKREDVYTLDEDLPKKVKRRLVSIRLTGQNIKHKFSVQRNVESCSPPTVLPDSVTTGTLLGRVQQFNSKFRVSIERFVLKALDLEHLLTF